MGNADIYLSSKADTVHILSIPQAVWAEKFGPHPRRFALYGASCVVGVRGKLFSNEGLETEIDYDTQASGAFTYVPQGWLCYEIVWTSQADLLPTRPNQTCRTRGSRR